MPVDFDQTGHGSLPGMRLTFPELAAITKQVDLDVVLEPGPFWCARMDALDVAVCSFDLRHGMDLFDLLAQHAVQTAWEIVESDEPVGDVALAAAVRTLALSDSGRLRVTRDREAGHS